MNHAETIEGFEVAVAALLEKMSICEFYAGIYNGVSLLPQSTANHLKLQSMLDTALPELYAAVVVFSVKARSYFEAQGSYFYMPSLFTGYQDIYTKPKLGINKITNALKSFDMEFQPFIEEINAKEGVIREYADAATMERVRSKYSSKGLLNIQGKI